MAATTIQVVTDATCSNFRELISSRIDEELDASDEQRLDDHLPTCAACTDYQNQAYALRRSLRMRAVEPTATATPASDIDAASVHGVSLANVSMLRSLLFVIGGTLILLNLSSLVSSSSGAAAHLDRHDGVFGAALGIGMLAVALKPHRAIGLVPLTSAIALLMLVVAVADVLNGNANLLAEAVHLVELAGLVCLWVISGGPSRFPRHLQMVTNRLRIARSLSA